MVRTLFILAIFGMATMVAFGQRTENRQVSGFTGINASSVFNITVQKGSTESLVIEADNAVMPYVRSEVRGGVLHLYLGRDFQNIETLNATVVMQNLEQVTLTGASRLTSNDLFTPTRFRLNSSGAASVSINLNTEQLHVDMSGASRINLRANAGNARLDISGASNVRGDLSAETITLNLSGASNVRLNGTATNINTNVSGTSNVNIADFSTRTAVVNISGTSNLTINATESLTINASGRSLVRYTGSPTVHTTTSGSARISRI